jgi:hypothetical protein
MMLPMQNFLIVPVLLFGFETLPREAGGFAESTPNAENDGHDTSVPSHTTRIDGRAFEDL